MSCPHSSSPDSSPSTCSQCLMAKPRKVNFDASIGSLTLDGVPIPPPDTVHHPGNLGKKMSGKRADTCGLCGHTGHRRGRCGR